jgi:hypothetical protein
LKNFLSTSVVQYQNVDWLDIKITSLLDQYNTLFWSNNLRYLDDDYYIQAWFDTWKFKTFDIYHNNHKWKLASCYTVYKHWTKARIWTKISFYWTFFQSRPFNEIDYLLILLDPTFAPPYRVFRIDFCMDFLWYKVKEDFYDKKQSLPRWANCTPNIRHLDSWEEYMNYFMYKFSEWWFRVYDKVLQVLEEGLQDISPLYNKYSKSKKSITRLEKVYLRRSLKDNIFNTLEEIFIFWHNGCVWLFPYFWYHTDIDKLSVLHSRVQKWIIKDKASHLYWSALMNAFNNFESTIPKKDKQKIYSYIFNIIWPYLNE